MAMREFVMSNALAGLHSWNATQSGKLECCHCGALAKVEGGTYYRLYPADPVRDCEVSSAALAVAEQALERDDRLQTVVRATFPGFWVSFPEGCDPQYVAAVLGALQSASTRNTGAQP